MAELADAPDLESGTNRCEGSSPFTRTNNESVRTADTKINQKWLIFLLAKNHPKRKDSVCNEDLYLQKLKCPKCSIILGSKATTKKMVNLILLLLQ